MKKKEKIKTIIIGFGRIAVGYNKLNNINFLTHFKSLQSNKNFSIIGVIDPSKNAKDKILQKYNIKKYNHLSELEDKKPKFAVISSPTNTHAKIIREILKNHKSVEVILCEKPFGNNFLISKKLLTISKKNNVDIFVNYMRVSDPSVNYLNKLIKKFFIHSFKGVAFYDGETLNQASHLVNLLQLWFGKVLKFYKIPSDKKIDKKYGINFVLEFKKLKITFIGLNIRRFSYASIELISSDGRIYYGDRGAEIFFQKRKFDTIFNEDFLPSSKKEYIKNDINNYQKNVIDQILKRFQKKRYKLCSADNAVETLRIMNKLMKK
ncbi:Gfo/Idh/MocA family oxidoreductase [Candidatus Pelagibacter sp.]|nr:Gfo/Idh/MocA family oxidoreductase [Candidatus Pelagibacter sp.]|tara:strand:- start:6145 stop:7107 length:963 start_codon:yes stop_codon:yes gene_type:complete